MTSSMLLPIRPASPQAAREVRRDTPLRRARTCYGHLAGMAGVELMDELLRRRWMEVLPSHPGASRIHYEPTEAGLVALSERGVTIPSPRGPRTVAFSCIDWTERRPHLGGVLGREIVNALVASRCIERPPGTRVVALTGALECWLGS